MIVFTVGSVKRGGKSGCAARFNGSTDSVSEGSGAVEMTDSSMAMEVKAFTKALQFIVTTTVKKAVIATYSILTWQKIQFKTGMLL